MPIRDVFHPPSISPSSFLAENYLHCAYDQLEIAADLCVKLCPQSFASSNGFKKRNCPSSTFVVLTVKLGKIFLCFQCLLLDNDTQISMASAYGHGENRQQIIVASCVTVMVLSGVAVALRFFCRIRSRACLWYDDYLIVAALLFSYAGSICILIG